MKKWIIPLLAVVLLLQGCTDQGANAKEVTDTVVAVAEEQSEENQEVQSLRKNLRRRP